MKSVLERPGSSTTTASGAGGGTGSRLSEMTSVTPSTGWRNEVSTGRKPSFSARMRWSPGTESQLRLPVESVWPRNSPLTYTETLSRPAEMIM